MPILKNSRRERFAQALASGKTATQAYAEAGYAKDRRNASRLTTNDHIRARVAELLSNAADRVVLNKEFVNNGLIEVVERGLQPKAVFRKGKLVAYRFNPAAAIRALELLGRELGMFSGRVEQDQNLRIISGEPLTEAEWEARYAKGERRTH